MRPFPTFVWFFDLDNTLHHAEPEIFPRINQMMTAYVADKLQLDTAAAHTLRQSYWQRYGATMLGLIRHHALDPHDFLATTHGFPELAALLRYEAGLWQTLRSLPGRKRLLTNAPYAYAQQVLQHLGVRLQIGRTYAVEQMRIHGQYRPKPSRSMLRALLAKEKIPAHRAILVEDTLANLKAARALGMRTVWVTGMLGRNSFANPTRPLSKLKPQWCNVQVKSVRALQRVLQRLR